MASEFPETTPKTWYVRDSFAGESEEKAKAFDLWLEQTLSQVWQECSNRAYDLGYLNEAQLLTMHEKKPKEWSL